MTGMHKSEFCDILEDTNLEETFVDFLIAKRTNNLNALQWISSVTADIGEAFNAPTYALEEFGAYVVSGQSGAATTATSTSETACEFFENFINQQIFENKVISLYYTIYIHILGTGPLR